MNQSSVSIYTWLSRKYIIVIDSGKPDNFDGCYWRVFTEHGQLVGMGESRGFGPRFDGAGSNYTAERLAKASARRKARKGAVGEGDVRLTVDLLPIRWRV